MRNSLEPDKSRIGFIFDGDDQTPYLVADLRLTENGILARLPWYRDHNPDCERWFGAGINWGDDPNKEKFRYNVPAELDYYDPEGKIALVGCRSQGSRRDLISDIGVGLIGVDYAVLGATSAKNYSSINGFRSEIEGLGTWMNLRSLQTRRTSDDQGRLKSVEMKLESPEAMSIHRNLNLKVVPSFQYGPGSHPDETVINERMYVESLVKTSRSWSDHLNSHVALRDLLRVAAWRQLNFLSHKATRDDDPLRTADGTGHGRDWYEVRTFRTKVVDKPSEGSVDFLFSHTDLPNNAISKWIRLSTSMSRGIDPIIKLLELERARLDTAFAQLGIGLEALGYMIALENGVSKKKSGDQNFEQRLRNIWNDTRVQPQFDGDKWIAETTRVYNSVKHANRTPPKYKELHDNLWRSILVFRFWIAGRLEVDAQAIASGQSFDHVARAVASFDIP